MTRHTTQHEMNIPTRPQHLHVITSHNLHSIIIIHVHMVVRERLLTHHSAYNINITSNSIDLISTINSVK